MVNSYVQPWEIFWNDVFFRDFTVYGRYNYDREVSWNRDTPQWMIYEKKSQYIGNYWVLWGFKMASGLWKSLVHVWFMMVYSYDLPY